jgi:hypothetical protein
MTIRAIDTLIDKQDNFEIVRDQIAAILVAETANQQALAEDADKDPALWKLDIKLEASDPLEKWLNIGDGSDYSQVDKSPIVNVWYQSTDFQQNASNTVDRQKGNGLFNVDIYGFAISTATEGGHDPSDKAAALEAQRAARLVRNILMAGVNTYLQLRGTVWRRWIQNIETFQPQINQQNAQQIVGARITFGVEFSEFSPQITPQNLDEVGIKIKRALDGAVTLEADYVGLET